MLIALSAIMRFARRLAQRDREPVLVSRSNRRLASSSSRANAHPP
jgi:hypothetical protein